MKWKQITPNGCDVTYRHGHRAIFDGESIYIYGGGNWRICKKLNGYSVKDNMYFLPKFGGKVSPGVASFGMAFVGNRIIIFGGMQEFGLYTNDLFTLHLKTWNWKEFNFPNKVVPEPRIGHSFTPIDEKRIYVFGGLINDDVNPNLRFTPKYMNDLYILHMTENEKFRWEKLPTAIEGPCGRESHSAVFHHDKKENIKFLIIFGGMNGCRLGDIWFLNLKQLVWVQFEINGIPPAPRSLHTANLIGNKMYVFGGWVDRQPPISVKEPPSARFETSNSLSYLDLEAMQWNHCDYKSDICPKSRAGHSAVAVNNRIYLWGGRSYYSSPEDDAACTKDFWYLETELPQKVTNVSLIMATRSTLEIDWNKIENAERYIVEIHKIQSVPIDLSKIRIKTNLPKVEQEQSVDQNKAVSIKRKLEELEITTSKKFNAEEFKPEIDNLSDEKKEEDDVDEKKNIIGASSHNPVIKESPIKSAQEIDKTWLTVGVYKGNSCITNGFYTFKINTTNLTYDNCPEPKDFIPELKTPLTDNTMYAFRIAAVNMMGMSEWSKMFYFKTADVDSPSMPNNCKFIPTNQGVRLAWNPNPLQERISAYSVHIAIDKNAVKNEFSFLRIYEGIQPTCHTVQNYIDAAYKEKDLEHTYIIFRITASNSLGTSSALLTSYLYDD